MFIKYNIAPLRLPHDKNTQKIIRATFFIIFFFYYYFLGDAFVPQARAIRTNFVLTAFVPHSVRPRKCTSIPIAGSVRASLRMVAACGEHDKIWVALLATAGSRSERQTGVNKKRTPAAGLYLFNMVK